jgi:hypothetical protein
MIDLVQNGEFEQPAVVGDWTAFAAVPGWSTTDPAGFELWSQGAFGSPVNGFDTNPTGQHLEINHTLNLTTISQSFVVPTSLADLSATLSFDAWTRNSGTAQYWVTGSSSGSILAALPIQSVVDSWFPNTQILSVLQGETVTINFQTLTGDSANSVHLDQVSFLVNQSPSEIPEPATAVLVLIGLGAVVAATRHRRSEQQIPH